MMTSFGRSSEKSHVYSPSSLLVNLAVLGLVSVAESLTLKSLGLPMTGDQRVDETLTKVKFSIELGPVTIRPYACMLSDLVEFPKR